jgi:hypothetical protein
VSETEAVGKDYRGNAEECAARLGRRIVYPQPNELFLDIDDAESMKLFLERMPIMGDLIASQKVRPSPSKTPYRFHVTVTLVRPVKDAFERILLQTLLGSDRFHEILSWKAASLGVEKPTLFFELPEPEPALPGAS